MPSRQFGENLDDWAVKSQETKKEKSKTEIAEVLFKESERLLSQKRFNEALTLINVAIENDPDSYIYYNHKAGVLEKLARYSDAKAAYDKSLGIKKDMTVLENKAVMLYMWANSLNDKKKALEIIDEAIEILDVIESQNLHEKFWYLRGSILDCLENPVESRISYLKAEGFSDEIRELENQTEYIKTSKDTLISITGTRFYFGLTPFEKGTRVNLFKEPENEHDSDAIRAEIDGETVGYVANSEYTVIENITSASDLKKTDVECAEVMFVYMGEYVIARLV